jgi:hypothetical protein
MISRRWTALLQFPPLGGARDRQLSSARLALQRLPRERS